MAPREADETQDLRRRRGGKGRKDGSRAGVNSSRRSLRVWKVVACACALAAVAVATAFAAYASLLKPHGETLSVCGEQVQSVGSISHGRSNELFRGFTTDDFNSVTDFLLQRKDLNLTRSSLATLNSNYIYMIEHYLPRKDDILSYLNDDPNATAPRRQAKVVLFLGASQPKSVKEYLVYPVPNPSNIEPLNVLPNETTVGWNVRPVCDVVEGQLLNNFLSKELGKIKSVLAKSFGQWMGDDCGRACLYALTVPRAKPDSPERRLYVEFFLDSSSVEGYYLYPVALAALVYTPQNSDEFALESIYYNGVRFPTAEALRDAYYSGGVAKAEPPPAASQLEGRYASPLRRGGGNMNTEQNRPPLQYSLDGQRFKVDQRHVDYLGWSFDLYFRTVSGVELFNVKYNGQPVAFEIAMQDVVVIYGGDEPHNFFKTFFDAGYSLGVLSLPLVRGADCPADAAYIDSVVYDLGNDRASTMKDAACIFEHKNSVPLRRHFSGDSANFNYAFSMPDSVLIVRQIVTVWNYDYIFDYEFHQNGLIEVKVSSTGYVVVTKSDDERYGFKLSNILNTLANVHGHYFHFKFDLDVAERSNSVTLIKIELESTTSPLVSGSFKQMKITRTEPTTEKQSIMSYDFSKPKYYVVHGSAKNNSLGHRRGFRVQSSSFADVMLPLTNPQMKGASWTKHQVVVTKQKDSERTTASIYTQGDPFNPVIDFQTFYQDDESIVNEDVVVWVTLGMHHVPCAEDLPVTTTPGRTLVASLVPFNYFDEDPSMSSPDAAVFLRDTAGEPQVRSYSKEPKGRCIAPQHNVSIGI